MENKTLSCWELKLKLESLEGFDFYVDMAYGNVKKGRSNACVIFSGYKNKELDFVYGNYNENGEYYIPTLEQCLYMLLESNC